jgi:SAM-dependent methyltransferase
MNLHVERIDGGFVPNWVRNEHIARFKFASPFLKGKVVVDCACGSGAGEQYFAPKAAAVVAFDLSIDALSSAWRHRFSNVVFAAGDAALLPIRSRIADVVVSFEMIEHIEREEIFLQEVRRVLRHDGIFLCSTPNRAVRNPGTSIDDQPLNPFHFREYSQEEFTRLLNLYFESVRLLGQNRVTAFPLEFNRFVAMNLSKSAAAWLNQLRKLPRLLFDRVEDHLPSPTENGGCEYEYFIAICSQSA